MKDKIMNNNSFDNLITNLDEITLEKLNNNNIYTVNDLWKLKRKDLKGFDLNDNEIKQIIIKMQLHGIDLNRRIYK